MNHLFIQKLSELLPLHAEEGSIRQEISREALCNTMNQQTGLSTIEVEATLCVIERLFDSAALLDLRSLAAGNWAFVSFPAYLMARSLTETLANPNQRFFRHDYWEQGHHRPEEDAEEQRNLLRYLELQRARSTDGNEARPIRYVHVAWGLIKLEGKFLMHHREDRARPESRNYVFPGGRLNAADLPPEQRVPGSLPELFQTASPLVKECLSKTLERELNEELKLVVGEDYSYEDFLALPPYRQVEGARNNHALTEYGIKLFQICLTSKGEVALYDRVCNEPQRFSWFSSEDLARNTLPDGRSAYIDALKSALGDSIQSLLERVSDSSLFQPRFSGESQQITIPSSPMRPFLFGKTGKEKSVPLIMTERQWGLLFALAWHRKGLDLKSESSVFTLLPNGWIRLNDSKLVAEAKQFASSLADAGLPLIEIISDLYLRVSVEKSILFFDDDLYSYALHRDGDSEGLLDVSTQTLNTQWGAIHSSRVSIHITENVWHIIATIRQGHDPVSEPFAEGWERNLREKIDTRTRQIGLRKFIPIRDDWDGSIVRNNLNMLSGHAEVALIDDASALVEFDFSEEELSKPNALSTGVEVCRFSTANKAESFSKALFRSVSHIEPNESYDNIWKERFSNLAVAQLKRVSIVDRYAVKRHFERPQSELSGIARFLRLLDRDSSGKRHVSLFSAWPDNWNEDIVEKKLRLANEFKSVMEKLPKKNVKELKVVMNTGSPPLASAPALIKCDLPSRNPHNRRFPCKWFLTVYQIANNAINQEIEMSFVSGLLKVASGAVAGVAAVTVLPIFGPVGTITVAGIVVGSTLGAAAGIADEINSKDKKQ